MLLLNTSEYEIKVSPDTGKGVFITKEIPAYTPVADYLGTALRDDEENAPSLLYAFARNSSEIIWPADIRAVGAHTVNHSCTPNCMYYPYEGHVLIVSIRKIFAGEELTCEYFVEPGSLDSKEDPHICNCSSLFCRGTLSAPEAYADKYFEIFTTPEREKLLVELNSAIPPLSEYPESVEPVGFMRVTGCLSQEPLNVSNLLSLPVKAVKEQIANSGRVLRDADCGLVIAGVDYNDVVFCLKN